MSPFESRSVIVSFENRQPIFGGGKPFHSQVLFGHGEGLRIEVS